MLQQTARSGEKAPLFGGRKPDVYKRQVQKGGTAPIMDVIGYGDPVVTKGLNMLYGLSLIHIYSLP